MLYVNQADDTPLQIGVKGSRSYRDFVELAKELMSKHTSFSDNITGIQTNLSSIPERKPSVSCSYLRYLLHLYYLLIFLQLIF